MESAQHHKQFYTGHGYVMIRLLYTSTHIYDVLAMVTPP